MLGVYFSGTGNSKFCVETFIKNLDINNRSLSIEYDNIVEEIKKEDFIVFGYPTQYSNIPKILKDFIIQNKNLWKNKKIFIITTMAMFSGDGCGILSRLLKKYEAEIVGGLHIKMPDSISDIKILKRSIKYNNKLIFKAEIKLKNCANNLKKGKIPKDGLSILSWILGLFIQRLYFYNKTNKYHSNIKINKDNCIKCKKCVNICPMNNLEYKSNQIYINNRCILCYRCVNYCPKKAITILGNKVYIQSNIEKYKKV